MVVKMTTLILMLPMVLSACAPKIPDQALTEIRRYIVDKTVIILLANQEALALLSTAETIIEKLFGNR